MAYSRLSKMGLSEVEFLAPKMRRPECVLATARGEIFASDGRGGVSVVEADGASRLILAKNPQGELRPNGIALLRDRSLLLANIAEPGGVWRLTQAGDLSPFLLEVHGEALPQVNFVGIDDEDRVWVTVSTRQVPMQRGAIKGHADGYVVLLDGRGARVVADGLGMTNEAKVDPSGRWLYVNETVALKTSRYPIRADGSLGKAETVTDYPPGMFPDGLAFDAEGAMWTTTVIHSAVVRVLPGTGERQIIVEDQREDHIRAITEVFDEGRFAGWGCAPDAVLQNPTSLAFAGPDLRDVILGFLQGERLARFRSPVAGAPPPHWNF